MAGVVLINLLLILHFKFENKRNTKDNRKRYLINYKSLIREQRHDYMNILQIVYGYIQLNKKDKAIEYVDRTTKMSTVISKLYRLSILSFSLFIDKKIREFYNEGIEVLCDVKNETDLEFREAKEEESIVLRLNKILDIVKDYSIQSDDKEIIMGIYEYNNGIDIVISKSMESTVIKNIRKIHDEVYTNNKELMISFKFNSVYNLNSNKTDVSNILYNS
ncbi:Spo0B domain-containing protein [Thermohalobacter berrensis]|uniref:Spo0B domain-containing protein n=1 Tax=Thermohalobacter berrensis TaxID=99594 RepID=UPI0016036FAE|nr:Spo0B domain-containing protein [Thermohalobacter berrensis]